MRKLLVLVLMGLVVTIFVSGYTGTSISGKSEGNTNLNECIIYTSKNLYGHSVSHSSGGGIIPLFR